MVDGLVAFIHCNSGHGSLVAPNETLCYELILAGKLQLKKLQKKKPEKKNFEKKIF